MAFFTSSFLLIFFSWQFAEVNSDEPISCGGFVKSEVPLQFDKIKVRLYTKEGGSLKYETDCAPTNGYYLIPIYNKGNYQIKLHPPVGWEFDPISVNLAIDGSTDLCSTGKDINFKFSGFTVMGSVVTKNSESGPANLKLVLKSTTAGKSASTTSTGENGHFEFHKVPPGKFELSAEVEDKSICFDKSNSKTVVTVAADSLDLGKTLEISGYGLNGKVEDNQGRGVGGITILLYGKESSLREKCAVPGKYADLLHRQLKPICAVESNSNGKFEFGCIGVGEYHLLPIFKTESVDYEIKPPSLSLQIKHETMNLKEFFKIQAYTVHGKVFWSQDSKEGVNGVQIFVNEKFHAASNELGVFALSNLSAGKFKITAKRSGLEFSELQINLPPEKTVQNEFFVTKFELCGEVEIAKFPTGVAKLTQRKLLLTDKQTKNTESITTDKDGKFCKMLDRKNYVIEPQVLPEEIRAGLTLVPAKAEISAEKSLPYLKFTQFKANVAGVVECIGKCDGVTVTLRRSSDDAVVGAVNVHENDGSFSFEDVLPDKYSVVVENPLCCWEKSLKSITVEADITDIRFKQTGYSWSIATTHAVKLHYVHAEKSKNEGRITLKQGANGLCMQERGTYKLSVESDVHQFSIQPDHIEVPSQRHVNIVALRHKIIGKILSTEKISDLQIIARHVQSGIAQQLNPLPPKNSTDGGLVYNFEMFSVAADEIIFEPFSETFLFQPKSAEFLVADDFAPNAATFSAIKGQFLDGSISPPLEDAEIRVSDLKDGDYSLIIRSDKNGKFRIGPVAHLDSLIFEGIKEGYVIQAVKDKRGKLQAFKLSELRIFISDGADQPISGVLVSVTGGDFRSNNFTGDSGRLTYIGLSPGSYFVRSVYKEYSFDPPTQMVEVGEGKIAELKLIGKRVAYSCFSKVRTLNGQPVSEISVEAIAANCDNLQEESVTEVDGSFRIRGLKPGCNYQLKLKSGNDFLETLPKRNEITVVDSDLHLKEVIILPDNEFNSEMEIIGFIDVAPDFLSTLKILLFRSDDPDSPLQVIPLTTSMVFFATIPRDNGKYFVRLETSLNPNVYERFRLDEIQFVANSSSNVLNLEFKPKIKVTEAELSKASYLILPLTILIIFAAYNHEKLLPFVAAGFNQILEIVNTKISSSRQESGRESPQVEDLVAEINAAAKKKQKPRKT